MEMQLQAVVDKAKKGGVLYRVADTVGYSKNVEQVFKGFGPNAKHLVLGVFGEDCPEHWIWDELIYAGFRRG
jgi:hypothetical protein